MSEVIGYSVQIWRQKAAEGTLTKEEMRQAIEAIRRERMGASTRSDASRATKATAKAKAEPVDAGALLSELDDL